LCEDTVIESRLCTYRDFLREEFRPTLRSLKTDFRLHRKVWEFYAIADTLASLGMLKEGRKGMGFAVGLEPLSAYFAKRGCTITASDRVVEGSGWSASNQMASSVEQLNGQDICEHEEFVRRVTFHDVDMNAIPYQFRDGSYDFLWSSCAFEHLGSITRGFEYVYNSLACLKSGGIAVHTTEFNVSSNEKTITEGGTVLFRKQDFEKIASLVEPVAELFPVNYDTGDSNNDRYVDTPPYGEMLHLKLAIGGYTVTSALLILRKK